MSFEKKIEIGGYMPLEVGYLGETENEPFKKNEEKDKIRFNSARYAISYAVQEGNFKKIYIPLYMCISVGETLKHYEIEYSTYSINEDFLPDVEKIENDACILICNYYGIQGDEFYNVCCNKYRNIIFDNTQAFYQNPIISNHIYNVYSPRKFVGCIDGAYLIKKDIKKQELPISESWKRGNFLLKGLEGTNFGYLEYLQSEDMITQEGMRSMSVLSQKYLSALQYEKLQKRRKLNFQYLVEELREYNQLHIQDKTSIYPMVYPLLPTHAINREMLVQRKIYVPQWWKWVINQEMTVKWEKELSSNLLPLPIDHRYGEKEMKMLVQTIKDLL